MSAGRIPPLPMDEWDDEVLDALSAMRLPRRPKGPAGDGTSAPEPARAPVPPRDPGAARQRAGTSNLIGVLSHHPALMKGWFTFNSHLFRSTLSGRVREMVTVRTAWLRHSEYEWASHVRMARAEGLSDDEIAGLEAGPDAAVWDPVDALVLRAVDQLCESRYVSDDVWAALGEHFDRRQVMDIVFTVAAYDALGMALENFGVGLDAGLEGFPAERAR